MIEEYDLRETDYSFFWQPNLQLPNWFGGTCRQVINRANQSKCKAGRQLQGSHPEDRQHTWSKLASREGFTQIFIEGAGVKGDGRGVVGREGWGGGCFNTESQEGGSVPHPGLDAASSGKVSAPGPGSPSPAQPQIDSAQRPDWPETEQ